jgi:hypothetical protein
MLIFEDKKKPVSRPYALDAVDRVLKKLGKKSKGGVPELKGDEVAQAVAEAFFKSEETARALRLLKGAFEEVASAVMDEKHDLPMETVAMVKKITKGKLDPATALFFVLAQAAPGSWMR